MGDGLCSVDRCQVVRLSGGCGVGGPFLADVSFRFADGGAKQVGAGPELENAVGDVDVDELASTMLADADLLPGHAHDAVAGHPAGDPVIPVPALAQRFEIEA